MFIGEISNLEELAKQLPNNKGADPQLLITAAFKSWGTESFARMRGGFAFSFKDEITGDVYLVRDQLGLVPLYYYKKNPLVHASSVRELLKKGVPRKLSKAGLHSYLAYGAVQDPQTMIEDVYNLPPATYLKVSSDGLAELVTYWKPSFEHEDISLADAQVQVDENLRLAIAESCRQDGELLAAFLSGGIDSSAIVALMRQVYPNKTIRSYCVIHEDPRTDEREWARMVANRNKTQHKELLLTGGMIKTYLRDAIDDYDQPSIDGLNVWFVSKLITEAGEKIALSGVGGDELFMGYGQFLKHRLSYRYSKYLKYIPAWCGNMLESVSSSEKLRKLAQLMGYRGDPYYLPRRIFSERAIKWLIKRNGIKVSAFEQLGADAPTDDLLNRISWMELRTSVLSMYLRDGYQTSVPHGLTVRAPLLDTRLVEAVFQIPGSVKVNAEIPKPLLVKAAGDGIPAACINRKKMSFSLPFDIYFKEVLKDELNRFFFNGESVLFDPEALRTIKRQYDNGKVSWSRIWALFMVDAWCVKNGVEL